MSFKTHAILLSCALLAFACDDDSSSPSSSKSDDSASQGPDGDKGGDKDTHRDMDEDTDEDGMSQDSTEPDADDGDDSAPQIKSSARNLVQWKRVAALEADLMQALELEQSQVCTELNGQSCARGVHLVTLGGNDPYKARLDEPSREPLATTATVVDRVLLSACSNRVELDASGDAKVFTALDLTEDAPKATASETVETIETLYRRLLRRDPLEAEVSAVSSLVVDEDDEPVSARDFASAACFAIGSTTEFLFF